MRWWGQVGPGAAGSRRVAPDDEGLLVVALRGEGDDVVRALQLRKGMAAGIPPQLHAATACLAIYHPCSAQHDSGFRAIIRMHTLYSWQIALAGIGAGESGWEC